MTNKKPKIRLVAIDIDGVLTNGRVAIDVHDNEYKAINYRDMDGINQLKSMGLKLALLSGEDTPFVDIIAKRIGIRGVIKGAKDKDDVLVRLSESSGIHLDNICYVGDADRDAGALKRCGLGMVPQDASKKAKESACVILKTKGGDGIVHEVIDYMLENDCMERNIS